MVMVAYSGRPTTFPAYIATHAEESGQVDFFELAFRVLEIDGYCLTAASLRLLLSIIALLFLSSSSMRSSIALLFASSIEALSASIGEQGRGDAEEALRPSIVVSIKHTFEQATAIPLPVEERLDARFFDETKIGGHLPVCNEGVGRINALEFWTG